MEKTKKRWILIAYIWYTLFVIFITPFLNEYLFKTKNMISEIFSLLLSVGVPVLFLSLKGKKKRENNTRLYEIYDTKLSKIESKKIIASFIIVIFFYLGMTYLLNFIDTIYIIKTKDYSIVNLLVEADFKTIILAVITYAILPPVFEEILYRGIYYDTLKNDRKILLYLVSMIVFSSCHQTLFSMINAFLFGGVLMYFYIETKSLRLVFLMHFVNNLLSLIFQSFVSLPLSILNNLNNYANEKQLFYSALFSVSIFLISIVVIIFIFIIFGGNNKKSIDNTIKIESTTTKKFSIRYEIILIAISLLICIIKSLS